MTLQLVELGCCPVCKTKTPHTPLYQLQKFKVYQCRCGVKFIDPSLSGESMMEIYRSSEDLRAINTTLEHYYEYETLKPGTKTYRDYSQALKALAGLTAGRELLEVGCGSGSFLKVAKEHGWQAAGVDSSAENVSKLQAEGLEAAASDFLDYQPPKKFDAVIFWDLIEHPQDPGKFIEKARELLKPQGYLLIASPHDPNLVTIIAFWLYQLSQGKMKWPLERFYVVEHTSYFSIDTIKRFLASKGFKTVRMWKTETDLDRYQLSATLRLFLKVAFLFARWLKLQNRFIAIAQKSN